MITRGLESAGFEVIQATDGALAERLARHAQSTRRTRPGKGTARQQTRTKAISAPYRPVIRIARHPYLV